MPQTCHAALAEGFLDDCRGQAVYLDIDLDGRDALLGTRNLEVHIAVEVLNTLDIGEGGLLAAVSDQAAGNTGDRRLDRDARIHQGQGRATDRALGRRTIGGDDLRNQAQRVGELSPRTG